jgi:Tol biopolymer transport system component
MPVFSNERVDYLIIGLHKFNTRRIEGMQGVSFAEPSWTAKNYISWYGYAKSKKETKSDSADFSGIYIANASTGKMTNIDFSNIASAWYPVLSPDARWIVFYAKDVKNKLKLMMTDVEGSFVEVLDESISPGQAPRWSHDSRRIVYNKLLDSGAITLGLITISPSNESK